MIRKSASGLLLALALGACSGLYPEEKLAPQAQAPGVEITKEQGGRFIAMVGPQQQHTGPFLGVTDTNYFVLRSWLDNKTGEVAHQLYIEDSYFGGPFKWNGVHDADGKPLKFIPISRNEISCEQGCSYADEFAAELPDDYLRAHRDGFAVTFVASDGQNLDVKVPPHLVTTELDALDTVRAIATAAAASKPAAPNPAEPVAAAAPPPIAPTTAAAAPPAK